MTRKSSAKPRQPGGSLSASRATGSAAKGKRRSPVLLASIGLAIAAAILVLGWAVMAGGSGRPSGSASEQRFDIAVGNANYEPAVVTATADRPVTLVVGQGHGCATRFLMPSIGVDKDVSSGPVTISLGKLSPGTYAFNCPMNMFRGQLVVQ